MFRRTFLSAAATSLSLTGITSSRTETDASVDLATGDDPRPQLGGDKVRPVISGIAEMPSQYALAYGTGGLLAERTGEEKIDWHTDNDIVRASNRHVYCADLGDNETQPIDQPSLNGDPVGDVVGYGSYDDNVDVAFRTMKEWEYAGSLNLDYLPETVVSPSDLDAGDTVEKMGARTTYTKGEITGVDHDVHIEYPGQYRTIEDTIETTEITNDGDSGSAVFRKRDNAFIGLAFAGNPYDSFIIPATHIEDACGVSFLTEQEIIERYAEYIDGENDEVERGEVVDAIVQYKEDKFSPVPRREDIVDLIVRYRR
jgi:hypothetical protein